MKAVLFTTFSLLLALPCFSQAIKKYVIEHTVNIKNIDTSATDYADLEPIGKAIGDARVVMLGEQDHGDATTFLAKTRLIKYLHEQKGFHVLAFESDFYGLTKGWDEVAKRPKALIPFFRENIFPIWTRSDACQYLFESYIPHTFQTQQPLQITGFDSQLFQTYSYQHLKEDLNQHLLRTNATAKFASDAAYQTFLEAVAALLAKPRKPEALTNEMVQVLEDGLQTIRQAQLANNDSPYWQIVVENLKALTRNSNRVRDQAMAANLNYVVNVKYRNEKVIVWAANTHVMKYTDHIKSKAKQFDQVIFENMGTAFVRDGATKTYVLGFASYQGTAGRLGTPTFSVQVPHKNGFENWIPEQIHYGFVDFSFYNATYNYPQEPFLMKSPMHFTIPGRVASIPWNLAYDGVFFIREMRAVKKAE